MLPNVLWCRFISIAIVFKDLFKLPICKCWKNNVFEIIMSTFTYWKLNVNQSYSITMKICHQISEKKSFLEAGNVIQLYITWFQSQETSIQIFIWGYKSLPQKSNGPIFLLLVRLKNVWIGVHFRSYVVKRYIRKHNVS